MRTFWNANDTIQKDLTDLVEAHKKSLSDIIDKFIDALKDDWSYKNSEISDSVIDRIADEIKSEL